VLLTLSCRRLECISHAGGGGATLATTGMIIVIIIQESPFRQKHIYRGQRKEAIGMTNQQLV